MPDYKPGFELSAGRAAIALPRIRWRLGLPADLGLSGPMAVSLALHAALILFAGVGSFKVSEAPLGIFIERLGVPGAGAPALNEFEVDYSLPSEVMLPTKKVKKTSPAVAKATLAEGGSGGGRLGNASFGASEGTMGDPNGVAMSARSRYLYELKLFFDQRKRYPSQARDLGQSGEVIVAFEILKDGKIQNVSLHTPSPFERLNRAALTLVQEAGSFKALPTELGDKWPLTVPIRYELN
jgi:TonB family protein